MFGLFSTAFQYFSSGSKQETFFLILQMLNGNFKNEKLSKIQAKSNATKNKEKVKFKNKNQNKATAEKNNPKYKKISLL